MEINVHTQRMLLAKVVETKTVLSILEERIKEGKIRAVPHEGLFHTGVIKIDSTTIKDISIEIEKTGLRFLIHKT